MFDIDKQPEPIIFIEDIATNAKEGLALNTGRNYIYNLNTVSENIGRKLTDSEVFGFSNWEHCCHKIFGDNIIDGRTFFFSN